MPVKPATRSSLVSDVLDRSLHILDRRLAARQIVRNYPSVIVSLEALIVEVCPHMDPPADIFDILADSWADVLATRA